MKPESKKRIAIQEIWPIQSILNGVKGIRDEWLLFAPDCEPFYASISNITSFRKVPTAQRGLALAIESGKPSLVFVPNRQLAAVIELARDLTISWPVVLIIEDHPVLAPQLLPRESAKLAGLSIIEPCDSTEVSFCAHAAALFSVSVKAPIVLLMHHGLLASAASEEFLDGSILQPRSLNVETSTPKHIGRRLELNRQRTLPSPGEQVEVGFVTVGGSDLSLKYLVNELQLLGRVPMLNIRLVHPIDSVPVERLLARCRHVVVLEPRPGEIEQEIIRIAQSMRREGQEVASIWGKELPPFNPDQLPVCVPVNSIHPSVVARLTQHLLHEVNPSVNIGEQLQTKYTLVDLKPAKRSSFGTNGALELLHEIAIRVLCASNKTNRLVINGELIHDGEGEAILMETWGEERFLDDGINVIRDAVLRNETRIILVWRNFEIGNELLTLIDAVLPTKNDDIKQVVEVTIDQGEELDNAIDIASGREGVSVIIVKDGEEPRFDLSRLEQVTRSIDQIGFRQQHAIVIPMEQLTPVRIVPFDPWKSKSVTTAMPLATSISTRWLKPQYRRWRISLRPILERVEVTRSKPPVRVVSKSSVGLTPPKVIHGSDSSWRVHIAGSRGDQPGVVGGIIINAGIEMGYEIRVQCNNRFVGPGRRAWSQLLFTRKQTANSYKTLIGTIPWGEADLLLGWDREEIIRSLDHEGSLRIGSQEKTYAVVNSDPLEHQTELVDETGKVTSLHYNFIEQSCKKDGIRIQGFASLARYRFHNERLGDVVQLGVAFQLGYIPVTVDAINVAVQKAEQNGFARSVEAFEFGRQIADESQTSWKAKKEESQIDLDRLEKRCVRDLLKEGRRGIAKSVIIKRLLRQCRQSLPGLYESIDGRQSVIDLINGIRRCMLWGGEQVANRYVSLLCQVYAVDSAENGRALTRNVILPLAEAILIREPIYLARLARSPEILRRIRKRLNVRNSRGDILKRRFLSRFRFRFWNLSLQADVRTSDWSSVVVMSVGTFFPTRWRGHRRDRAVRELLEHAVAKAVVSTDEYNMWVEKFKKLNQLALDSKMHSTTVEEIQKIIQS
jgi:Pyruvate/2-oxoacid:ferredoxin oxidoreductase gamma subunit